MKRVGSTVAYNTRSKKPRLTLPLIYDNTKAKTKEMVSATSVHNYMINDCLVDWLKLRTRAGTRQSPAYLVKGGFTEFIMNRGIEFERELIKYIDNCCLPIVTVNNYIADESCQKTIDLMQQGVPILHSAPVKNTTNGTHGIIDLLVRSDFLYKLVEEAPLSAEEAAVAAPKLGQPYHYVVVDIKFSTLPLRADGIHLLNSGRYTAYKAQMYIYNEAIGKIQGYTSPYAFILGRRWKYTQQNIPHHNYTCLNKLGRLDFNGVDSSIPDSAKLAIKWVRDVRTNGAQWSINPPSRPELYPNMCVDSGIWNMEKEKIADNIGEITSVWYLGVKQRNIALKKDITSWRNKNCTTKNLDFLGNRAPIVDKIMAINRQNTAKIWPEIIKNNTSDWKNDQNELFVDFETLSDIFADFTELPCQKNTDMIFMIGVGGVEQGKWFYKNFTCKEPTYEEEYRIMNEFVEFLSQQSQQPRLRYWCAEDKFWHNAECRQFDLADDDNDVERKDHISDNWKIANNWLDLYNVFIQEPIVIKDCFKFGLKAIAKTMRKHGMIKTNLDSNCDSGMSAMINAANCYKNFSNPIQSNVMQDISKYNEFDCKVLWEIIKYLRDNHM